ncbi:hypothetical protein [Helicobacter sp. T3_23-1059]
MPLTAFARNDSNTNSCNDRISPSLSTRGFGGGYLVRLSFSQENEVSQAFFVILKHKRSNSKRRFFRKSKNANRNISRLRAQYDNKRDALASTKKLNMTK